MAAKNRNALRDLFKGGAKPSGQDFSDLIDSVLNSEDDGIEKPSDTSVPLKIVAHGVSENLLDFYANTDHTWRLNQKPTGGKTGLNLETSAGASQLFINSTSGNVGLGNADPKAKLHIKHSGVENALQIDYTATDAKPLVVDAKGNVGIGAAPSAGNEILQVTGNTQMVGELTVSQRSTLTGNVGIGEATNPNEKLRVAGNTRMVGKLLVTDIVGIGINRDELFSRVCIPSQKLAVIGDTILSGSLQAIANSEDNHIFSPRIGIGINDKKDVPATSSLYIKGQRLDVHNNISLEKVSRFDGLPIDPSPRSLATRAQIVLSSAYSDLVIASSLSSTIRQTDDQYGSTLTFAAYDFDDPTKYNKWVINQGNWGGRKSFLEFGYSDANGRDDPHKNINDTDTVLTLDGKNKRVGIGTRNPDFPLHIKQTENNKGIRLDEHGTGKYFRIAYEGNGVIHFYHSDNKGQFMDKEGNWHHTSDVNLKEKITALTGTLKKVMRMKPVHFRWRNSNSQNIGFVAQDVEPIFPELVSSTTIDGQPIKGLSYSSFGVIAISAIQELKEYYDAKIEALERKISGSS